MITDLNSSLGLISHFPKFRIFFRQRIKFNKTFNFFPKILEKIILCLEIVQMLLST